MSGWMRNIQFQSGLLETGSDPYDGNKRIPSCVGAVGSSAEHTKSPYFRVTGMFDFYIDEDGHVHASIHDGWLGQNYLAGNVWYFSGLAISRKNFSITLSGTNVSWNYDDESAVPVFCTPSFQMNSEHHSAWPSGYQDSCYGSFSSNGMSVDMGPLIQLDHNEDASEYYIYAAGYMYYNSSADKWLTMPSARIILSGFSEALKYFPWERKINGSWMSLDRGGNESTSTGLFRMKDGKYEKVLNDLSSISDSHGFRYNNGWQRSPKSGEGA